jgi:membrane associated rhomboid family serine protease
MAAAHLKGMDTPPPPSDDPRRDPPRPWGAPEAAVAADPVAEPEPEDTSLGIDWARHRALLLVLVLIGLTFLWQMYMRFLSPVPGEEWLLALSTNAVASGRWWTFLTSMYMHGGALHLLMNLSALLPFGLIIGQRMGGDLGGQARLLGFYTGAGLVAGLAWLLMNPGGAGPMVGASGAIFGLWGGVIRMRRDGSLYPLFSREVGQQLIAPVILNVIITVAFGVMGGMGGEVAGIAWQAHLGGFVFGLLTIGLFVPRRQA